MAQDKRELEERVQKLEEDLAAARRELESKSEPVPASHVPVAGAAVPTVDVVSWRWVVGLVVFVGVVFAIVSPYVNRPLVPQRALPSDDPLPDPPAINIPAPGQPDAFGRPPASEHYGHDHPIEEDEDVPR